MTGKPVCPRCQNPKTHKAGFTNNTKVKKQRWFCIDCGNKFIEDVYKTKRTLDKYDVLRPQQCDICKVKRPLAHTRSRRTYEEYKCQECNALHHVDKPLQCNK